MGFNTNLPSKVHRMTVLVQQRTWLSGRFAERTLGSEQQAAVETSSPIESQVGKPFCGAEAGKDSPRDMS
jgi:hypothetical protein